jgi:PPK2 family polyphosphate:nucleotide phosphotransferase
MTRMDVIAFAGKAQTPLRTLPEEFSTDFRKEFVVEPGAKVHLSKINPSHKGKYESREQAAPDIAKNMQRMDKLQYLLYADDSQSLIVVLQALDAGGKDGTVRHVFSGMNPQGTRVFDLKQPSKEELAHDFLWRAHLHTPAKGQVVIFNRSHYEDVLVVRVHNLVPQSVWSKRYDLISDFEKMLSASGTHVLKFYLHISPEEQLARFAQRLDDPARNWKISESDYSERALLPQYVQPTKTPWPRPARSARRGTSSRRTTNGSATSRYRRSSRIRWMRWA